LYISRKIRMFARAKLKIMFKTTSTLQKLQKKSSDALGIFQATERRFYKQG